MNTLPLAALAFVATHLLISGTPLRGFLVRRIGLQPYRGLYSLIALATIVWLVRSYNATPLEVLWAVPALRWAPLVLMPFALILVVTGMTSPNPAGMGPKRQGPLPGGGIQRVTRHPANMGIALWALGHVLANGDTGSLWFFGALLVLAVLGSVSQDRRKAAELGASWQAHMQATSLLPLGAVLTGRNRLALAELGLWRPALALGIYAILIWVHPMLFGVRAY